jgi:hypothetical protein
MVSLQLKAQGKIAFSSVIVHGVYTVLFLLLGLDTVFVWRVEGEEKTTIKHNCCRCHIWIA